MGNASSCEEKHDSSPVNVVFNVNSPCCHFRSSNFITHHVQVERVNDCTKCEQAKNRCICMNFDHQTESNTKQVHCQNNIQYENLLSNVKFTTGFVQVNLKSAVIKMNLCCSECERKVEKIVNQFKGVCTASLDKQKDLITVTGIMDVEALLKKLKKMTKRTVMLVAPKKEDAGCRCNGCENIGYECYCYCYKQRYANAERYYTTPPFQPFSEENPNACTVM